MDSSGIGSLSFRAGEVSGAQREQFKKTRDAALNAAADFLQESPDQLKQDLANGQSLSEVAASKGLSGDGLTKAVESAVKAANPNASDDQATQITNRIVNGHHHHHHHAAPPSDQTTSADHNSASTLPPDSTLSVKA